MPTVSVRYIVDNVDEAIPFYCDLLGFEEVMHPAPPFAMLRRGDLRLLLSQPGGGPGGGQAGGTPVPGGWNRFAVEVEDLDAFLEPLRTAGVKFRGDIAEGIGGRQVIAEDPSGNPSSSSSRSSRKRASSNESRETPAAAWYGDVPAVFPNYRG